MTEIDYGQLEKILDYSFENPRLLIQAVTHSSYANETTGDPTNGNERLEFLGDAVLELCMSNILYKRYLDKEEGDLTKLRAAVVCENSLALIGEKLGVCDFLLLGKGEENHGGRHRRSLVADAMEAVIGAVYLDGGLEAASVLISRIFEETVEAAVSGKLSKDSKTELQELLQGRGDVNIRYQIVSEDGPDHDKTFTTAVFVNGKNYGEGQGHSKKISEQAAAMAALEKIKSKQR